MDYFKPTIAKFAVLIIIFKVIPFFIGKMVGLGALILVPLIPSFWFGHLFILIGSGDFIRTPPYELMSYFLNTVVTYVLSCFIVFLVSLCTKGLKLPPSSRPYVNG